MPFEDAKALKIVCALIKDVQPTKIVHLGDLIDCYQISSFDKDPDRKSSLQDDIDAAAIWLGHLKRAAPKAKCYLLEGNHEDRLRRTIWRMPEAQRELTQLRAFKDGITWPKLLGLDALGWEFIASQGQARAAIVPRLVIKHGQVVRRWSAQSAKAEWERYGRSGISGHTHRMGKFYTRDFNGNHLWVEAGCTCDLTPQYVEDPNWQQGVIVVTERNKRFTIEDVYIQDGVGIWRDQEYRV